MTELGTTTADNLFAGNFSIVTEEETILSGQDVTRKTVMGKITASGKLVIVDSSNSDGSEVAYCIMAEDIDASAADTVGIVYKSGEFSQKELIFGGSDVYGDHKEAMRSLGMYLKDALDEDGVVS